MEGGDGAHAFHAMNVPASLEKRFAEQRPRRRIAEQQKALGPGQRDVLSCSCGAILELFRRETGAR